MAEKANNSFGSGTREKWIDILKGIGIILVVLGHVNTGSFFVRWIYTFHMPCFFALSGYLLYKTNKNVPIKQFILKRAKTILLPYIIFQILLALYWIVVESHFRAFDMGPIWFLLILFFAEIIAYLFIKMTKKIVLWNSITSALTAIVWLVIKTTVCEGIVKAWLLRLVNGLLWFLLGYLWGILEDKVNISLTEMQKILLTGCFFICSVLCGYFNAGVSMWSNVYGNSFLLYIFGGIIGSLWLGLLCKWFISNNVALETIGQNTITILAVHEPIKRIVLKCAEVLMRYLGADINISMLQENFFYSIAIVIVVLLLCIIVVIVFRLVKSKMPPMISKNIMTFVR